MTEVVLDASVVLKWFTSERERGSTEARTIRSEFEAGSLTIAVPALLFLEVLNVIGRRWGWEAEALAEAARALTGLGLQVGDPELEPVAEWVARGLTAYDAAYVALAEERGIDLVTDDGTILAAAPDVARPLIA